MLRLHQHDGVGTDVRMSDRTLVSQIENLKELLLLSLGHFWSGEISCMLILGEKNPNYL